MSGKLIRGTQIAYIPTHAQGNLNHPDTEFGFVTKLTEKEDRPIHCFCRYWTKGKEGKTLRTISCSECTPYHLLVAYKRVDQALVDELIEIIEKGGEIPYV